MSNENLELMELENEMETVETTEMEESNSGSGLIKLGIGLGVAAVTAAGVAIGKHIKNKKEDKPKKPAKKFRPRLTLFETVEEVEEDIIDSEAVDVEETEE